MNRRPYGRAAWCWPAICSAVVASLMHWPGSAPAQDVTVPFSGNHACRRVLADFKLQALDPGSDLQEAADTLVIVFGDTRVLDQIPKKFVSQGGAIWVATDEDSGRPFLGCAVSPEFVIAPDPNSAYRGELQCPIVSRFRKDHPIFQGIAKIATNRPKKLVPGDGYRSLAFFPPDPPRGFLGLLGGGPLFAAARTEGSNGKILLMSDQSVFINGMMLQNDNDNLDFAYNCVDWLTDHGRRRHVLYFHEGEAVKSFDVPLKEIPEFQVPVEVVDRLVAGLEDEDIFNRMILQNGVSLKQVLQGWAVALTGLLLLYGLFRLMRARHRTEPEVGSLEELIGVPQPPTGQTGIPEARNP